MDTSELREKRVGLVAQARELVEKAASEDREMTSEEESTWTKIMEDVDRLGRQIERGERLADIERTLDEPEPRASDPLPPGGRERGQEDTPEARERREQAAMEDFGHFLRTGHIRPSLESNVREAARLMGSESRDLEIATDAKGGYLVAPVRLTREILKEVDNQVYMRRLATRTVVTDAKKTGIRKITSRLGAATRSEEIPDYPLDEDTSLQFGRRELEPMLLTSLVKSSIRTLALSADAEPIIRSEMAYQFAVTEEQEFLTGTGSGEPLGVFTASASGISTDRDVLTGDATGVTADGLIDTVYAINSGYLTGNRVGWIMHRDVVKAVRKLKDGNDQYLWVPGLQPGEPDLLLNYPVYTSEYAPNTFSDGNYAYVFGNFTYYRIVEMATLVIQRLTELFARTHEVGFIGRMWNDGAPLLEQAFARGKFGAS